MTVKSMHKAAHPPTALKPSMLQKWLNSESNPPVARSGYKEKLREMNILEELKEKEKPVNLTPVRKKLVTDQKVKKVLRKFGENDITIDLEVIEDLTVANDSYKFEMKNNIEDERLAVRKRKGEMKPTKDIKLRKLKKKMDEENAGPKDDEDPDPRLTQDIPSSGSELATKLFGIFDLRNGGRLDNGSFDDNVTLPYVINNSSAQDCTAGSDLGETQPIGGLVRIGQGYSQGCVRDEGLGLAGREGMNGNSANERVQQKKSRAEFLRGKKWNQEQTNLWKCL